MPYTVSSGIIGFNEEMIFGLNFDEFLRKDKEIKGRIFQRGKTCMKAHRQGCSDRLSNKLGKLEWLESRIYSNRKYHLN